MINKERIQQLVDEFLAENEDIFLVSLKIGGGNQIGVDRFLSRSKDGRLCEIESSY